MTPEQKAAYFNAQTTVALIELEAKKAANRKRIAQEYAPDISCDGCGVTCPVRTPLTDGEEQGCVQEKRLPRWSGWIYPDGTRKDWCPACTAQRESGEAIKSCEVREFDENAAGVNIFTFPPEMAAAIRAEAKLKGRQL